MEEIVEIKRENKFSSFHKETYEEANIVIKRLAGYGITEFNPPLEVRIVVYQGSHEAYVTYDFGMCDSVPVTKGRNCLYNYSNDNKDADPILTALSTIKYDLEHALHHYDGDPNYNHRHWALRGELWDRSTCWDWYEVEEYGKSEQLEFDF